MAAGLGCWCRGACFPHTTNHYLHRAAVAVSSRRGVNAGATHKPSPALPAHLLNFIHPLSPQLIKPFPSTLPRQARRSSGAPLDQDVCAQFVPSSASSWAGLAIAIARAAPVHLLTYLLTYLLLTCLLTLHPALSSLHPPPLLPPPPSSYPPILHPSTTSPTRPSPI